MDQINKFSSKLCVTTTDSNESTTIPSTVSSKSQHSNISQAVSPVLSEEREKDKPGPA